MNKLYKIFFSTKIVLNSTKVLNMLLLIENQTLKNFSTVALKVQKKHSNYKVSLSIHKI